MGLSDCEILSYDKVLECIDVEALVEHFFKASLSHKAQAQKKVALHI